MTASGLLAEIADVGRDPKRGGYSRHAFDASERDLRTWFAERAQRLGLDVETDDQRLLDRGSFVYDALYAWCRRDIHTNR